MTFREKLLYVLRLAFMGLVRFVVGAYPSGAVPRRLEQTIFFANHTSHLDTLTLLAALPVAVRDTVRPVAARDYWCKTALRKWVATEILNVVFVDRASQNGVDPLVPLRQALKEGSSLIIFPEGTRTESELPGPFKSGLWRLSAEFPRVQLVPVYLENLHRILPKGTVFPVPLINKVHFGAPLTQAGVDDKAQFLTAARQAVCDLSPGH